MTTPGLKRLNDAIARVEAMEAGAALKPLWKGDVPGVSFVNNDEVACNFGDLVMYDCPSGNGIEMDLPATTPADVGKRIGFHYTTAGSKAIGTITLDPEGVTDNIEELGDGTAQALDEAGEATPWFELTYDGNGSWRVTKGLGQFAPADFFV